MDNAVINLKNTLYSLTHKNNNIEFPDLRPDLYNNQITQRHLFIHYQNLKNQHQHLPRFSDTGFRVYSQNDEDGLLLFIFALIGFTNKVCVDIAFASPYGANVTNLICNWGFTGLLIDGSDMKESQKFFQTHKDTWIYPPKIVQTWVTETNINNILKENKITGEIDLLSLDLDGVDYWIWKAIEVINPRVVVLEYMNIFDATTSVTVPYKDDFNRYEIHEDFFGASIAAFVKLGKSKGYRLIGCNKYGFNAFFLRNDIGKSYLPTVSAVSCLQHLQAKDGRKIRLPQVKNFGWIKV